MSFIDGMERVAKVIDCNVNYKEIVRHRLPDAYVQKIDFADGHTERLDNARSIVREAIEHHAPLTYLIPEWTPNNAPVLAYARTHNNLKELSFFKRDLAPGTPAVQLENLADLPKRPARVSLEEVELAREACVRMLLTYLASRQEISAALVLQLSLYAKSYMDFWATFLMQLDRLPCLGIFANDHAPVHVALSMCAKAFGIHRMYLQHAEVTEAFPPLDFETAVLRNEMSQRIYQRIAASDCRTFVVPRDQSGFDSAALTAELDPKPQVVIYPTARINEAALTRAIETLRAHPEVGGLGVKEHPNGHPAIDQLVDTSGVMLLKEIPAWHHVALVGNSSIAIELLRRGKPVYQCFELDPVPADYYGFHKQGLTLVIAIDDLGHRFWRPYKIDSAWLAALESYDPGIGTSWRDDLEALRTRLREHVLRPVSLGGRHRSIAGRWFYEARRWSFRTIRASARTALGGIGRVSKRARTALERVVRARLRRRLLSIMPPAGSAGQASQTGLAGPFVRELLVASNAPEDVVAELRHEGLLSLTQGIEILSALLGDRARCAVRILERAPERLDRDDPLEWWIELKGTEWCGLPLRDERGREILHGIQCKDAGHNVNAKIVKLLLRVLMGLDRRQTVVALTGDQSIFDPMMLGTNSRVALYKYLAATAPNDAGDTLSERLLGGFSRFERLKLVESESGEGADAVPDHRTLENRFRENCPKPIQQDFEDYVAGSYERLRAQMRLMDVRVSQDQRQEMLGLVRSHLWDARPMSLVRLSDGEGYAFPRPDVAFSETDARNRERHWWGEELTDQLRAAIREGVRTATRNADILGIPSIYRFIRDHDESSQSLRANTVQRGLISVLLGVSEVLPDGTLVTEDKCNLTVFRDLEVVRDLVGQAPRVCVIASARRDLLAQHCPALGSDVTYIQIPTHFKTSVNPKYLSEDKPLPCVYDRVLAEIDRQVAAGDLVLVAGGIIGKLFVDRAKQRGGIALDIGSALDEWIDAGIHSLH